MLSDDYRSSRTTTTMVVCQQSDVLVCFLLSLSLSLWSFCMFLQEGVWQHPALHINCWIRRLKENNESLFFSVYGTENEMAKRKDEQCNEKEKKSNSRSSQLQKMPESSSASTGNHHEVGFSRQVSLIALRHHQSMTIVDTSTSVGRQRCYPFATVEPILVAIRSETLWKWIDFDFECLVRVHRWSIFFLELTPTDYLEKYCRVNNRRHTLYKRVFDKHKDTEGLLTFKVSKAWTMSERWDRESEEMVFFSVDLSSMFDILQVLPDAISDTYMHTIDLHFMDQVIKLLDLTTTSKLTFPQFQGIAAFSERYLFNVFT